MRRELGAAGKGGLKKMMDTTMTGRGGYASSHKWDDMRAQTEVHSIFNVSNQSP